MGVIKFLKTNCKNCYSCVRACSVGAIRVKNEQAEIIEERCIACGKCIKACPKDAKKIETDVPKAKKLIEEGQKIAVSLAPSFVAAFGEHSNKLCAALKSMGFKFVEETSIGAEMVNREYEKYAGMLDQNCYITSCCSSLNDLIQKHYPELIPNLIPVISPMVCHKRLMKQKYGEDIKIVFIGPCIAKKNEAKEEGDIDAVITFDELVNWFKDENINLENFKEIPFDDISLTERRYPILGGVTLNMDRNKIKREILHIDGMADCLDTLSEIRKGRFKDTFIEMNLCRHGCIDGPAMPQNKPTAYERVQLVKNYANSASMTTSNPLNKFALNADIDMKRTFKSQFKPLKQPSEEEMKKILARIGKYSPQDELNCGTCGYKTCRDKAVAVFNDMAEPTMCLPFMKQKAENLSNVIFDMTPTIIVVINENLDIIDYNPAAESFFNIKRNFIGLHVSMLMELDIINQFLDLKQDVSTKRVYMENQKATVFQSIIKVEDSDAILILINDFTDTLKQEEKLRQMKINAIDMAQQVIDKQMRVAQEIASLLGETTAETKVSLTKLKKLVKGEEVELK